MSATENQLNARPQRIHERLAWISDTEARAAWVKGYGAGGEFDQERDRLIAAAKTALNELQAIGARPSSRRRESHMSAGGSCVKRDMGLVRDLLLRVEGLTIPPCARTVLSGYDDALAVPDHPPAEVDHHLRLLVGAGLLDGPVRPRRVMV